MAANRKYSALPDLDSAPDIYETPELTDDNSTLPATTDAELDDASDDPTSGGISRTRLRIDQARSRFMPASVDARDVDFSDRLSGKRKSYKTSSRRQRVLEDGTEEYGELSDDDAQGSLARKLARLKREVEEARQEAAQVKEQGASDKDGDLASLSQALDEITRLAEEESAGAPYRPAPAAAPQTAQARQPPAQPAAAGDSATYSITYAPTYAQTHALAKAADFDRRLLLLEQALGLGSTATTTAANDGVPPRAVLPTLDALQRQVSTLSEASTSSLDSISRRVRALASEADALAKARRDAKAAQEALGTPTSTTAGAGAAAPEGDGADEQQAKINALYGTLPTIDGLAPLLPPLLDRLRSLRAIHADAAGAAETLDGIERRQADMASDIALWREGLEKVEGAMKEADGAVGGNVKAVEGWLKELEARMAKLS